MDTIPDRLVLVAAIVLMFVRSAEGCSCISSPAVADWRDHVDVIFQGKIKSRSLFFWGDAVFSVARVWKGQVGEEFRVEWRRGDRGDCNGFWPDHLRVGVDLLVFAKRGPDGVYRTSVCYPTKPSALAREDFTALGVGRMLQIQ